jgi:ribosomal protein L36
MKTRILHFLTDAPKCSKPQMMAKAEKHDASKIRNSLKTNITVKRSGRRFVCCESPEH